MSLPLLCRTCCIVFLCRRGSSGATVFREAASFSLFVPLCFLFPGVLLSHVSLSIWPAAREQWLMVEIRIETSLVGYRLSLFFLSLLVFLCLSVYFCAFLNSDTPSCSFFLFLCFFFTHIHAANSFLLKWLSLISTELRLIHPTLNSV